MPSSDIRVEGTAELRDRLRSISETVSRKEVVRILRKGAPPIKREMKRLAPSRSGTLRKSIVTRRGKRYRELGETVLVGPSLRGANKAPHAHLVELGTKGGQRRSNVGRFSIFTKGGDVIRTRTIKHPGTAGVGFIERAYNSKSDEAAARIAKEIDKVVQR